MIYYHMGGLFMSTTESFISIANRTEILVRGVSDILEYDNQKIILYVADTELIICGENFNIKKIDVDNKVAEICGEVNSFSFVSPNSSSNKSFFKTLFK